MFISEVFKPSSLHLAFLEGSVFLFNLCRTRYSIIPSSHDIKLELIFLFLMLTKHFMWIIVLLQSLQPSDTENQVQCHTKHNVLQNSFTEDRDKEYVFFAEL